MKKLLSVLVGLAVSSGAMATSIVLTENTPGNFSGSFGAYAATNTFELDLSSLPSGLTELTALLTANFTGSGYDVTGAKFDGVSFTPVVNVNMGGLIGVDYWTFQLPSVSHAMHTIVVNGAAIGGSTVGFTGSISVTNTPIAPPPVPEPQTYAMMLAGLGALSFLARRRQVG